MHAIMSDVFWVWLASALCMAGGWWLQVRTRNAGIVDVIWSATMSASALYYATIGPGGLMARFLVATLGGFWGFRLAMHLLVRVLNEHEDGRYRYLREHWRGHQGKFFLFFQFQALLTAMFSLPFMAAAQNPAMRITPLMMIAIVVWLVSIGGEALSDRQLAEFRAEPANRGRTCRAGLWRYSRHPNYFFEWLHWFTYVLLAWGAALFWLAWIGPVLMLISLRWVTGIPFVEAQALRSRPDDYREYQRNTSIFFPWFPAKPKPQHRRQA
jgi:steroid 5-alpha reductase family enzyme